MPLEKDRPRNEVTASQRLASRVCNRNLTSGRMVTGCDEGSCILRKTGGMTSEQGLAMEACPSQCVSKKTGFDWTAPEKRF